MVWPELDRRQLTPLGVGIQATADDLLRATQLGDRALTGARAATRVAAVTAPRRRLTGRPVATGTAAGLRTPLLPPELPAARSRAEQFDQVVLAAVAAVEQRWPQQARRRRVRGRRGALGRLPTS